MKGSHHTTFFLLFFYQPTKWGTWAKWFCFVYKIQCQPTAVQLVLEFWGMFGFEGQRIYMENHWKPWKTWTKTWNLARYVLVPIHFQRVSWLPSQKGSMTLSSQWPTTPCSPFCRDEGAPPHHLFLIFIFFYQSTKWGTWAKWFCSVYKIQCQPTAVQLVLEFWGVVGFEGTRIYGKRWKNHGI